MKRLWYLLFVLWGISLGTFALFSFAPGDPAEIILRNRYEAPNREQIDRLRREMGLDDPWGQRYARWLQKAFRGDWGISWQSGRPVLKEIADRLPATVELATAAFIFVVAVSSVCGVCAVRWQGRFADRIIALLTVVLSAMPVYWLGLLLIYLLSLRWPVFPVSGRGGIPHLVLPALTLALGVAVLQGRVLRITLIRILRSDYIRFAVAVGMNRRTLFFRHMIRNALPAMVALWGVCLGQLLGGAVIVESVFAWPGLGQLTVAAILGRDIPLIQAIVLLLAMVFVLINQAVEALHRCLDPKIGAGS